jgi:hypothetical protein
MKISRIMFDKMLEEISYIYFREYKHFEVTRWRESGVKLGDWPDSNQGWSPGEYVTTTHVAHGVIDQQWLQHVGSLPTVLFDRNTHLWYIKEAVKGFPKVSHRINLAELAKETVTIRGKSFGIVKQVYQGGASTPLTTAAIAGGVPMTKAVTGNGDSTAVGGGYQ